jgi:ribonuclease R
VDTVIKSKAKLSYEQVQDFFNGDESSVRVKNVCSNLKDARELARLLNKRRCDNGSLDFDLPESLLILDEQGDVIKLSNRVRTEAHRLVEEFMLVANQAMALEVFRAGEKMLYRVHDKPDMEKLEAFAAMMSRLGHKFTVSKEMKPISLARFLNRVKDSPEADFINEVMLRSMQKAVYQSNNLGHFGLAFTHYTHFTSPIRRYADLLIHRLVRALKNNKYPPAFARRIGARIDQVGRYCSDTERVAERAERAAIKIKQAAYMARHLGDEFDGIITGVTGYGFYVRLSELGAEGMVKLSSMDDDYYLYEEKQFRLIGRRRGRIFRLGDQIKVGVQKVDTVLSEIDLFVVKSPAAKRKSSPPPAKLKTRRKAGQKTKVSSAKARRKKKAR